MSRFPGWTPEAIEALQSREDISGDIVLSNRADNIPKNIPDKKLPDYVGTICNALQLLQVPHQREYKFLHDRRFRFDIAIPEHKLAIEFEGGIYSGGRHTRGRGYASDVKKYNLATMHGWRLFRYTSEDAKEINWEFKIANEIKNIIEGK